jgi:hypothetical protein
MTFKRLIFNNPVNITGIWNMNQYGNTQTSLSVQISNTQITLCQGNLIFNYSLLQAQNIINLKSVLSSCPSQALTSAVQASKYFRYRNGILDLFDSNVSLTVELVYSSVYDPTKPLFPTQALPASIPTQSLQISTSNLVGRWSVSTLFNIPFPSSPYFISFTSTSIQLIGGCNNYTFGYNINSTTQTITVGNSTSTNGSCGQSDDQLYASGINKMYKYLLSSTNGIYTLNFYDQTGAIGYTLQNKQNIQSSSSAATAKATSPLATQTSLPLSPGTYLLLLLQRRDLPRLLVNITANTVVYKGCNTILQSFSPFQLTATQSSITFTGGPTTNNSCALNNDSVYYGALNLVKSYSYDPSAGAVVFSNAANV